MPTYQYACKECDHRFEAVQSFTDANLSDCPECSGRLRKLFGSVGVIFKGSGFYRNDSRSGSTASSGNGKPKESTNGDSSSTSDKASASSSSSSTSSKESTTATTSS